jgi:uncharacterized membrane protein
VSEAEHRVAAPAKRTRFFRLISLAALIALIALTLLWELVIAPLRPGGSWMAFKALPLLFAARGTAAGDTYTFRWALMLVLAYFAEGCVRFYSDAPPSSTCALAEIALAASFFTSAIAYIRSSAATRLEGGGARRGPA